MIWYGTFRRGQPLSAHFVTFEAHDWYSACEILDLMYQLKWDCCFSEDEAHMVGDRTQIEWGATKVIET